jgi:hypothetical protein
MPTKISVAMCKETGPPQNESLEVTCAVELDDDWSAPDNPDAFQHAAHSVVVACQEALQAEKLRQA